MLNRLLWSILLLNLVVIAARLIQLGIRQRQHGLLGQTLSETLDTTILYFWGPHCSTCRTQAAVLATLERQLAEPIRIVPLDATVEQAQADRYQVLTLPTTVVLRHGAVVAINNGYADAATLQAQITAERTTNQRPISTKPIGHL